MSSKKPEGESGHGRTRSAAEWTTLLLCLAVVACVAGLLIYSSLGSDDRPVAFQVTPMLEEARHEADGHHLPVEVRNIGHQTAEHVRVTVRLVPADGASRLPAGAAEFEVRFLAGGERARGVVVLESDPSQLPLEARVVSYTTP